MNDMQPNPDTGDVIQGQNKRWRILQKMYTGDGYDTYDAAEDVENGEKARLWIQRNVEGRQLLEKHSGFLSQLADQGVMRTPRLLDGSDTPAYRFMCTTLYGTTLQQLLDAQPQNKFSLRTSLHVGREMLECIREVHEAGMVYRALTPEYVSLGYAPFTRSFFLTDFTFARQHRNPDGTLRPKRPLTAFRGTLRYSSVRALLQEDQGRVDDLWSWFFVLVEMSKGLPWDVLEVRFLPWGGQEVLEGLELSIFQKMALYADTKERQIGNNLLLQNLPDEYAQIQAHLHMLQFEHTPDYDMLFNVLRSVFQRKNFNESDALDWEEVDE